METNARIPLSEDRSLRKACVLKVGDKYYFPKTIPKERENTPTIAYAAVSIIIFFVHVVFSTDPYSIPVLYASVVLFYVLTILTHRLILFLCELTHSISRYERSKWKIFKAAFHIDPKVTISAAFSISIMVHYLTKYSGFPSLKDEYWPLVLPILFVLHKLLDGEECPLTESLNIAKDNGLNYGAGMAYSFFYGYINYMLNAKIGIPNKDLREMMQDYESSNNISFEVYKIFILIPKSLYCYESLADGSNIMEMRKTLLEKKITVAGVRERVYKHSVYSITDPVTAKQIYVCAEYATPLKTFMEVYKHQTAHTEFYERQKNEILFQFYHTMKRILELNGMDVMCELVFYEDLNDKKQRHDTGRILLSKLKEYRTLRK